MNDQMKPIKTSLDHPLKFPEGNHVQLSYCFVTNCSNHVSYCFVTFLPAAKPTGLGEHLTLILVVKVGCILIYHDKVLT